MRMFNSGCYAVRCVSGAMHLTAEGLPRLPAAPRTPPAPSPQLLALSSLPPAPLCSALLLETDFIISFRFHKQVILHSICVSLSDLF